MLRAVALRFESGAITSTSIPSSSRSARRSAWSPSASIPSSLVSRTRTADSRECGPSVLGPLARLLGELRRLVAGGLRDRLARVDRRSRPLLATRAPRSGPRAAPAPGRAASSCTGTSDLEVGRGLLDGRRRRPQAAPGQPRPRSGAHDLAVPNGLLVLDSGQARARSIAGATSSCTASTCSASVGSSSVARRPASRPSAPTSRATSTAIADSRRPRRVRGLTVERHQLAGEYRDSRAVVLRDGALGGGGHYVLGTARVGEVEQPRARRPPRPAGAATRRRGSTLRSSTHVPQGARGIRFPRPEKTCSAPARRARTPPRCVDDRDARP